MAASRLTCCICKLSSIIEGSANSKCQLCEHKFVGCSKCTIEQDVTKPVSPILDDASIAMVRTSNPMKKKATTIAQKNTVDKYFQTATRMAKANGSLGAKSIVGIEGSESAFVESPTRDTLFIHEESLTAGSPLVLSPAKVADKSDSEDFSGFRTSKKRPRPKQQASPKHTTPAVVFQTEANSETFAQRRKTSPRGNKNRSFHKSSPIPEPVATAAAVSDSDDTTDEDIGFFAALRQFENKRSQSQGSTPSKPAIIRPSHGDSEVGNAQSSGLQNPQAATKQSPEVVAIYSLAPNDDDVDIITPEKDVMQKVADASGLFEDEETAHVPDTNRWEYGSHDFAVEEGDNNSIFSEESDYVIGDVNEPTPPVGTKSPELVDLLNDDELFAIDEIEMRVIAEQQTTSLSADADDPDAVDPLMPYFRPLAQLKMRQLLGKEHIFVDYHAQFNGACMPSKGVKGGNVTSGRLQTMQEQRAKAKKKRQEDRRKNSTKASWIEQAARLLAAENNEGGEAHPPPRKSTSAHAGKNTTSNKPSGTTTSATAIPPAGMSTGFVSARNYVPQPTKVTNSKQRNAATTTTTSTSAFGGKGIRAMPLPTARTVTDLISAVDTTRTTAHAHAASKGLFGLPESFTNSLKQHNQVTPAAAAVTLPSKRVYYADDMPHHSHAAEDDLYAEEDAAYAFNGDNADDESGLAWEGVGYASFR